MAVDSDDVPAVGFEPRGGVVDEPRRDLAVNRDAVVVVQGDQFIQLPSTCQSAGFVADAFHHATIAHEHIGVVIDDVMAGAVEFGGQQLLSQRHTDRIGNALTQRTGGGFHARRDADLGVSGSFAVQLAEVFQLAHRQVVAGEV